MPYTPRRFNIIIINIIVNYYDLFIFFIFSYIMLIHIYIYLFFYLFIIIFFRNLVLFLLAYLRCMRKCIMLIQW